MSLLDALIVASPLLAFILVYGLFALADELWTLCDGG